MTILSILTKEETFQLIEYLKNLGISFSNNLTPREKYEIEYYAPIVIPRLAFEKNEITNQYEAKNNPEIAFEHMEKLIIDEAEFSRNHERDGDMFYFIPEDVQKANLEAYYDNHHLLGEPQQSWQISCNKILEALKNK
jgi:hypothetical protein